ncbi:transglycosylase SLT domain-containing protein [Neisseria yangbaofengii]|uniref:transglycosylase SLT domain-containing protein n=1 Tax=Neisseria yangbaofengii TaxID=2709396 RepID=UPI00197D30AD|nr:transglycosylase SLT domain-containing protein [Neisseria yangbaofengii]
MKKNVVTVLTAVLLAAQPAFAKSAKEQVEGCLQGKIANKSCLTMIANYWKHSPAIEKIAREEGVDPGLFKALVAYESRYNRKAVSRVKATGLTQVMPGTAADLGVHHLQLFDAEVSIRTGSRYLRKMLDEFKSVDLALAAYNAGPGNVRKYGRSIPPFRETRAYVRNITSLYRLFQEKSSKTENYRQGNLQKISDSATAETLRVSLPSKPTPMRGSGRLKNTAQAAKKSVKKQEGYFHTTERTAVHPSSSGNFQSTGKTVSHAADTGGYFQSTGS